MPDRIYGPDITNLISGTLLCQIKDYRPVVWWEKGRTSENVSGPKKSSVLPRDVSLYSGPVAFKSAAAAVIQEVSES